MPLRVVLISDRSPELSGSGGGVARYGLGESLLKAGYDVHFVVLTPARDSEINSGKFITHFLGKVEYKTKEIKRKLRAILIDLSPEVVYVYHTHVWPFFSPLRKMYPHVLYSLDPAWITMKLRQRWNEITMNFLHKTITTYQYRWKVFLLMRAEKKAFREASEFGIVAGYITNEVPGMRDRTGVDVRECFISYPEWEVPPRLLSGQHPRALLLGNLNSIHTRYGLKFFFDEIWPAWSKHPNKPEAEVRIVGGGKLPPHFKLPAKNGNLKWIGFVSSIEEEWSKTTALLVPVPLSNGIRSRIVEAWCRGVPVIAHPAAEVGLPMMEKWVNYIPAKYPIEWIRAMKSLEQNNLLTKTLSQKGREVFLRELSSSAGAKRFSWLTELAIERYQKNIQRR